MECSFCGRAIPEGTEVIFVTRKGRALYLCSSKCDKNLIKLGRKPRKVKWTREYAKEKEARRKTVAAPAATPMEAKKKAAMPVEEPKEKKETPARKPAKQKKK